MLLPKRFAVEGPRGLGEQVAWLAAAVARQGEEQQRLAALVAEHRRKLDAMAAQVRKPAPPTYHARRAVPLPMKPA